MVTPLAKTKYWLLGCLFFKRPSLGIAGLVRAWSVFFAAFVVKKHTAWRLVVILHHAEYPLFKKYTHCQRSRELTGLKGLVIS